MRATKAKKESGKSGKKGKSRKGALYAPKSSTVVAGRFIDSGDGTITDLKTRLMWAKESNSIGCYCGKKMTWNDAVKYAKSLSSAGYSDWRLPEIEELISIVDYSKLDPAIHEVFLSTPNGYFWTSTVFKSDTRGVWVVGFDTGRVNGDDKSEFFYLRCVRNIK